MPASPRRHRSWPHAMTVWLAVAEVAKTGSAWPEANLPDRDVDFGLPCRYRADARGRWQLAERKLQRSTRRASSRKPSNLR